MPLSGNGWLADENPSVIGVVPFAVGGIDFVGGVRGGDAHTVLHYVATQVHQRVEPANASLGCWGYSYRENVNSPGTWSNHASATAIDFNAEAHPNGSPASANWTAAQIDEIRAILAEVEGAVRWGGDYQGTPDAMHFEIDVDAATLAQVAAGLLETPALDAFDGVSLTMLVGETFEFTLTAGFTGYMVFWGEDNGTSFNVKVADRAAEQGWPFVSGHEATPATPLGSMLSIPVSSGDPIEVVVTAANFAGVQKLRWQRLEDGLGVFAEGVQHTRVFNMNGSPTLPQSMRFNGTAWGAGKATFGSVDAETAADAANWLQGHMWVNSSVSGMGSVTRRQPGPSGVTVDGSVTTLNTRIYNWKTDKIEPEGMPSIPAGINFSDFWESPDAVASDVRFKINPTVSPIVINGNNGDEPYTMKFRYAVMRPGFNPGAYQTPITATEVTSGAIHQHIFDITATMRSGVITSLTLPETVHIDLASAIDPASGFDRHAQLAVWPTSILEEAPVEPPDWAGSTLHWAMSASLGALTIEMDIQSPGYLDYQYLLSDNLYTPPPPEPLVAAFTWAVQDNGYVVDFDASSSSPQPIATYAWDFGDPLIEDSENTVIDSPLISYAYGVVPYVYLVTLTVTDELGQMASVTQEVALIGGAIDGELRSTDRGFLGY